MREFLEAVANEIEDAEVRVINKNGIDKECISVKLNDNVAATIYYEMISGLTVSEAVEKINAITEQESGKVNRISAVADFFTNYENVKKNLRARLYRENVPAEVKRSAKGYGFDDLIIVPYCNVEMGEESGSIKILKAHLEQWGVSEDEVIDQAIANMEEITKMQGLFSFVARQMGMDADDMGDRSEEPMIVSTDDTSFGAGGILTKIDYFKERFTNGFYVLPSSLHEVLVVPAIEGQDVESLTEMVQAVNATEVAPEEVLSSKAYAFI